MKREFGWAFVQHYLSTMTYSQVVKRDHDLLDAVVLAMLGKLSVPFDPSNPVHAAAAEAWKTDIKQRGVEPSLFEGSRESFKHAYPAGSYTEHDLETYACFMHASWENAQPMVSEVAGGKLWQDAYYECGIRLRFFVTDNGRIGMASTEAEPGDVVAVLFGARVPFLLRPVEEGYIVISSCYCYTIMRGQYTKQLKAAGRLKAETKTFVLR
ncbi:Hypothetical predicted protein [Lecanosticta acicola]|uniref:Uncharacterized protein n=1 Tax=Lecanosticta acicola TaxID=111012 RepID=A0AAI8Z747_9PEZI|nr:Hypothetical predicted protein [Lecanosticta acicola]